MSRGPRTEAQGFKEEGSPVAGDTRASGRPSRETPTSLDALELPGKTPLLPGHQLAALLPLSCSIPEITQPSSPTTHHSARRQVQAPLPGRQVSSLLPVKPLSLSNSVHPYQQEKQLQAPFSKVFKSQDIPGVLPHTPGHSIKAHPTFYDLCSESLISHLD